MFHIWLKYIDWTSLFLLELNDSALNTPGRYILTYFSDLIRFWDESLFLFIKNEVNIE